MDLWFTCAYGMRIIRGTGMLSNDLTRSKRDMKFYIILLRRGKVIEVNSYDTEESRDSHDEHFRANMYWQFEYDEVQILNQV